MPRKKRTPKATSPAAAKGVLVYRVKLAVRGAGVFYVLSTTRPVVSFVGDVIASIDWTPVEGTDQGDTLGYVRWADVSALAWRLARIAAEEAAGEPAESLAAPKVAEPW